MQPPAVASPRIMQSQANNHNLETDMKLHGKEHQELMTAFEQFMGGGDFRKESKEFWSTVGAIYANGEINQKFLAYRAGYEFHRCVSNLNNL